MAVVGGAAAVAVAAVSVAAPAFIRFVPQAPVEFWVLAITALIADAPLFGTGRATEARLRPTLSPGLTLAILVLFGIGPVTLLSGGQVSVGEGLLRLLTIAAFVAVSMLGLSAIGLFASTLTVVPVGAMAATAILAVAAQIAGAIPQLEWLHPCLFTDRWFDFADLLRSPFDTRPERSLRPEPRSSDERRGGREGSDTDRSGHSGSERSERPERVDRSGPGGGGRPERVERIERPDRSGSNSGRN